MGNSAQRGSGGEVGVNSALPKISLVEEQHGWRWIVTVFDGEFSDIPLFTGWRKMYGDATQEALSAHISAMIRRNRKEEDSRMEQIKYPVAEYQPMEHVNHDIIRKAIAKMEPEFHSGELLFEIRRIAEHEYIRELGKKLGCEEPHRQVNADIMSRLNFAPFADIVEKTGAFAYVDNMMGTKSTVPVWRKK